MNNNFWSAEIWRILLVLFIAVLGGMLSYHWLISLALALAGYIIWLLYKFQQLYQWLKNGAKTNKTPDNSGLFEQITQQILLLRKKSIQRKKQLGKLLKRSQGIITSLPDAAIILNQKNEIEWSNKISASYLNIDIKRDLGQRIDNLVRISELREMLESNTHEKIECSLTHNAQRKLALQLIPIQKNLKLLIAQDITERSNLLQMRKNFIANASHELRTPLTVIAGYLEMMLEDVDLPKSLQPIVISAFEQSTRMQQIIEDMLLLSRLENSALNDEDTSIIDMPSVLQTICKNEISLIRNKSHSIETDIDASLKIKGLEVEITSACSNLIHNAVRHTGAGTKIKLEWKKNPSGKACLVVMDTGEGIPAEDIPHLTERFYRVDKGRSRDKGGTGLGLAIVQHIVLRHGGTLDIKSIIGKGSTFTISFPQKSIQE